MNIKGLVFLSAILLTINAHAQKAEKRNTEISEVTVFLTGAEIMRSETISVPSGKKTFSFEGLSPNLDPNSVKLKVGNGLRILAVNSEVYFLNQEKLEPKIKVVSDSITLIAEAVQMIKDEQDAYTIQKNMLNQNQKIIGEKGGSIEDLKSSTDYFYTKHFEINKKLSALSRKLQKLYRVQTSLNQRVTALKGANNHKRNRVIVTVESSQAKSYNIELSYIVAKAGWEPVYDIYAQNISSPITLIYKAKAFNNTSISWDNVKLSLSSADPYLSAELPTLSPWFLKYENYQTFKKNSRSNSSSAYNTMQSKSWSPSPGDLNIVGFKEVLVPDVPMEFEIDEKYTIVANAKPHLVGISETSLQAEYKHMAVPILEKSAFLIARVTGWESLNLIEGPANIYFEDQYVGKSKINTFDFSDTLNISLGRDNKVLIERVDTRKFKSKSIIGGTKKESYEYTIKVKNLYKNDIQIEIVDQYPVSQNSEITVDVQEISNAEENEETGILVWNLNIPASSVNELKLSYTIKMPKGKQVVTNKRYRTISAPSF